MSIYDIAKSSVGLFARQTSVVGHDVWRAGETRAYRYKEVPQMGEERRRAFAASLLQQGIVNERTGLPAIVTTVADLPTEVAEASGLTGKPGSSTVVDIKALAGHQLPVERLDSEGAANSKLLNAIITRAEEGGVLIGDLLKDDIAIETIADAAHEIWMEYNSYMKKNQPELFVPYAKLPPAEQLKDVDRVKAAITNLVDGLNNLDAISKLTLGL